MKSVEITVGGIYHVSSDMDITTMKVVASLGRGY